MYRVLIVEDDPMVAMINEQYVNRNPKFHVTACCRDGASAITQLEKTGADLVIMDVYMPLMNGIEVLHTIRSKKLSVDVIMVTAANDRTTLEEAIRLGVIDYLVKPFDFNRFQLALGKFAAQHDALSGNELLNQQCVDHIIDGMRGIDADSRPKGIQENTLNLIAEHMRFSGDKWFTGEEIAESVGLSAVTVRRYMNHLVKTGAVLGEMNYETGGRPCMLYRTAK